MICKTHTVEEWWNLKLRLYVLQGPLGLSLDSDHSFSVRIENESMLVPLQPHWPLSCCYCDREATEQQRRLPYSINQPFLLSSHHQLIIQTLICGHSCSDMKLLSFCPRLKWSASSFLHFLETTELHQLQYHQPAEAFFMASWSQHQLAEPEQQCFF